VRFQDGHHWALNGDGLAAAAAAARSTRATAGLGNHAADIVKAVAKLGQASPADVANQLGLEPRGVRTYLGRLVDSGRLIQVERGVYTPPPLLQPLRVLLTEGRTLLNATVATEATAL
jgi:predicted transcriptional regulator of viral defense system